MFREGLEPPSFAHQATALAAVLTEPGSKPGDRTLRVRHMKPASPPGELLAMLAGRRGVEPRWSDLETNPIPDRSPCSRDSGRTRTAIPRFGLSDPVPLEDGVSRAGVVYGSRTRVTGVRTRPPGLLEEHDLVRAAGIEPAISGMSYRRSPAELRAHPRPDQTHGRALGRNRTDTRGLRGCDTTFVLRGHTVERTAGFEPAWTSSGTKRRTQRPRPHRASGWT